MQLLPAGKIHRLSLRAAAVMLLSLASAALAQTPLPVGPDRKVQVYKLDTVELKGTTRLEASQITAELGLTRGTPLDDELVMNTRSRLLGLGLFRSVILIMRKGSEPGTARLIIEVEDDPYVLTDWALGGDLAITGGESANTSGVDQGSAPMDYRVGLVGRNLFSDLHRGSAMIDIDSEGNVRAGQLTYGLPRFTREDVQFDAEIAAVNPHYRYLDSQGFGGRGQGLWSQSLPGLGELQYGPAMYINKEPHFALRGFPKSVAGPKVAFFRETRLRGFFPGDGHMVQASLLLSPGETEKSVIELGLARTVSIERAVYFTLDTRALAVGTEGYSVRGEGRVDIPLGVAGPDQDQAEIFIRLRGGQDSIEKVSMVGSAAIFGLRYHSSGFIAELAFKVTRSPQELTQRNIAPGGGAGE